MGEKKTCYTFCPLPLSIFHVDDCVFIFILSVFTVVICPVILYAVEKKWLSTHSSTTTYPVFIFVVGILLWYWGLNWRPCICQTRDLPLYPHVFFFILIHFLIHWMLAANFLFFARTLHLIPRGLSCLSMFFPCALKKKFLVLLLNFRILFIFYHLWHW